MPDARERPHPPGGESGRTFVGSVPRPLAVSLPTETPIASRHERNETASRGMSETKRQHVSLHEVLAVAMPLVATQLIAKLVLPNEWLAAWTMWHIVGVSALIALSCIGVATLVRSRSAKRRETSRT